MKKFIKITFNIPGFHYWDNAPDDFIYLKDNHRHIFYWTVLVNIEKDNREIEFIDLKDLSLESIKNCYLCSTFGDSQLDFGNYSCEIIAQKSKEIIEHSYFDVWNKKISIYSIEVTEDNENGALIIWG